MAGLADATSFRFASRTRQATPTPRRATSRVETSSSTSDPLAIRAMATMATTTTMAATATVATMTTMGTTMTTMDTMTVVTNTKGKGTDDERSQPIQDRPWHALPGRPPGRMRGGQQSSGQSQQPERERSGAGATRIRGSPRSGRQLCDPGKDSNLQRDGFHGDRRHGTESCRCELHHRLLIGG